MRDFRECLERSSLADLQFSGHNFTWTNHSVSKKLDRILCNEDWVEQFSDSIGVFGKPGISDHSPCCIFLDQLKPPQKRSFRFFAHLNDHPEFSALIKFTWNALPFYGSKQLCVSKKLKEVMSPDTRLLPGLSTKIAFPPDQGC
ncbi:BnaC06g29590D [Brassica napus]|uniref:BnaC06g29590D protein n=1 Tax=Brassica napus TaxID=3708 RepID=A0A078H9U3_BRANA|nr:BnaC06g29590D [Brassica napus]